jgi:hypothetical protein
MPVALEGIDDHVELLDARAEGLEEDDLDFGVVDSLCEFLGGSERFIFTDVEYCNIIIQGYGLCVVLEEKPF